MIIKTKPAVLSKAVKGFTLVELLVVISIIAMLLAVLMPALSKARGVAKRTMCGSNFKQVGLGMIMYATNENNGILPEAPNNQHGYYWPREVLDTMCKYVGGYNKEKNWIGDGANLRYPDIFKCPAKPDAYYGYSTVVNVSYFLTTYGGHYKTYNRSEWYVEPPRKVDQSKSTINASLPFSKVMAADVIWWWPGNKTWYGPHILYTVGPQDGIKMTKGRGTTPGSNSLYLDGHVEFVPTNKMKQYVLNHWY